MTDNKPSKREPHPFDDYMIALRASLLGQVTAIEDFLGEPRTSDAKKWALANGYVPERKEAR